MTSGSLASSDGLSREQITPVRWAWPWTTNFVKLTDTFALRLGSDKGHMTAGFGLGFQLFGAGSPEGILDYSYRQDDVLDYTHRFALSVLWE